MIKVVVKNFLFLTSGEVVSRVLGFLTTVYLARVVGIEGFGKLGFVWALYAYFAQLASQGFETVGVREVARGSIPLPTLTNALFSLRFLFSLASFILLLVFAFLASLDRITRTLLLLQGLNLLLLSFYVQFFFRGTESMKHIAGSRILQSISYLTLAIFFVKGPENLLLIPFLLFIATILSLIPLLRVYKKVAGGLFFHFSREAFRPLLQAALPLGLSGFMIQIYYNLDSVMLGFIRGTSAVGIYTAAYKIVLILNVIPNLILSSFFPSLARVDETPGGVLHLKEYVLTLIVLGIPLGFIGYFISPLLIQILFGSSYHEAVVPLQILFVNASFVFLSMAFANPLTANGKNREYLQIVMTGAAVNVVLNILLIPSFGLIGAAVATVLSEAAVTFRAKRELNKSHLLALKDYLVVPLLFAFIAFGFSLMIFLYFSTTASIAGVFFLISYVGLIFGWKEKVFDSLSETMATT